jgi:hypothetical protein
MSRGQYEALGIIQATSVKTKYDQWDIKHPVSAGWQVIARRSVVRRILLQKYYGRREPWGGGQSHRPRSPCAESLSDRAHWRGRVLTTGRRIHPATPSREYGDSKINPSCPTLLDLRRCRRSVRSLWQRRGTNPRLDSLFHEPYLAVSRDPRSFYRLSSGPLGRDRWQRNNTWPIPPGV